MADGDQKKPRTLLGTGVKYHNNPINHGATSEPADPDFLRELKKEVRKKMFGRAYERRGLKFEP